MKSLNKVLAAGALTAAIALSSQQTIAATDGTLGATSTGTSVVSLSIASQYRISGLTDFAFGTYGGTGALTANSDLCVYTNEAGGEYNITITDNSSMSASDFSVQNAGATADIPFSVSWNDVTGISGNAVAAYGDQVASTGANTVSSDCSSGGDSANLQVNIAAPGLQSAPAGAYSTTLTLLVEPQ